MTPPAPAHRLPSSYADDSDEWTDALDDEAQAVVDDACRRILGEQIDGPARVQ